MIDYVLSIDFEDPADEEAILARLFLTASTGSTSTQNTVEAYFDSPEDRDAAAGMLDDFELRNIDRQRQNWLELYQQSLQPMHRELGDTVSEVWRHLLRRHDRFVPLDPCVFAEPATTSNEYVERYGSDA